MDKAPHIADLIVKKIWGKITPDEQKELDLWINENPGNRSVYERATDPKRQLEKLEIYRLFNKDLAWSKLEDELFGSKTVRFTPRIILRYAAAIMLPLLLGGIGYLYFRTTAADTMANIDKFVQPGTQKALLILSDGNSLELDNEESYSAIKEGTASISIADRQVVYTAENNMGSQVETLYNELRTPRGGSYNLKLADGTTVWLNAGSSLKFPVSFRDSVRQVQLEGEAYFEVVHSGTPFIVHSGPMSTRVLGTSFNISAFPEDKEFKITLVEGKVMVALEGENQSSKTTGVILEPNEQAIFIKENAEIERATVNASDYISWINGKMEFHNEDLEIVMKRLSRWYNFEYEFVNQEAKSYHFSARLNRDVSISVILEMLEMTTDVKFELRNTKIVVL